jgi:hypothetical protein
MVKTFHIMDKPEWGKFVPYFHQQSGSHYIDLPSGKILVAVAFSSEASENHFEDNAGKDSLPHPVWNGNDTLTSSHVEELFHLFDGNTDDEKKVAASKATTKDVAAKVSKIHPLMRLRIW